ncbi:MAG TPA: dTDP-4-dehydrorhamnose 3,5-epimerase [Clostridiales bacterium]|nr:dTDP-4-dehydrorhamnose 3,5-epimerase [Clostridiales bacterium]
MLFNIYIFRGVIMSNMSITESYIKGLFIIESKQVKQNESDLLTEYYNKKLFCEYELFTEFISNVDISTRKGCLRGLYFYRSTPVFKLIKVLKGEVYIVAVDLRRDSPTYSKSYSVVLSNQNRKQFYIPNNFAYGFLSLEDTNILNISSNVYNMEEDKFSIAWNDRDLKIEWPLQKAGNIIISRQNQKSINFNEITKILY